jgi:hypothetical protein
MIVAVTSVCKEMNGNFRFGFIKLLRQF